MRKNIIFLTLLLLSSGITMAQKLSPKAQTLVGNYASGMMKSVNNQHVSVYIKTNDVSALGKVEALGGKIGSRFSNGYCTATVPVDALESIAAIDAVKAVKVASDVKLLMDVAREDAGVDKVQSGTEGFGKYDGSGVVVGVVDNGFEFGHIDFYDTEGKKLRISRVWNQNAVTGTPPEGYTYGAEYTTEEAIKKAKYDVRTTFHGTHVTGIAAGSDMTMPYYGVAPGTELVLVSFNQNDASVVDGVKYIFDYAKSVGKPAVVNLSLGQHLGPHDGTSAMDQVFDELSGPGRIIVGAAGNEGYDALHASKIFASDTDSLATFPEYTTSGYGSGVAVIDIWGTQGAKMSVRAVIYDSFKKTIIDQSDSVSTSDKNARPVTFKFPSSSGYAKLALAIDPDNGKPNVYVESVSYNTLIGRKFGLIVKSEEGATVNMWNAGGGKFTDYNIKGWTDGDTDCTVGEIGGTANSVISVGAYNTKTKFIPMNYTYSQPLNTGKLSDIANFSSHGPTADGRTKPDVAAPGAGIVSAASKYDSSSEYRTLAVATKKDDAGNLYYYSINMGTSMASPFVTGTVALWLQADPTLTADKVRDILRHSSRHDDFTGEASDNNYIWGTGKIDAFAGLQYLVGTNGIRQTDISDGLFRILPNLSDRTVKVFFDETDRKADVVVYNAMGQKVARHSLSSNGETIDVSNLPHGLYVLKLSNAGDVHSVKVML